MCKGWQVVIRQVFSSDNDPPLQLPITTYLRRRLKAIKHVVSYDSALLQMMYSFTCALSWAQQLKPEHQIV